MYTHIDSNLSPEKIKVVHHDSKVQNYIDNLAKLENSDEYQDHLYMLVFT